MKKCKKCLIDKKLDSFKKKKGGKLGVDSRCKECESTHRKSKEYRGRENKRKAFRKENELGYNEKIKNGLKKYKSDNKEKVALVQKNWFLKKLYGIDISEFDKMYNEQNGCCAICEKHQSLLSKGLSVDHDHETGKIRKLLCGNCNTAIGLLDENILMFNKCIDYLIKHKE